MLNYLRIGRLWRGYLLAGLLATLMITPALADETCNSPFVKNLIKGQEDYVYVWTLGVDGVGDGFDKLVTIDVNPGSSKYGKVIDSISVGRRGEAHHMGFTEDRRYLWAGGLDDSCVNLCKEVSSCNCFMIARY